MMEHIWPVGLKGSEVPQTCTCTFDPVSISESILSVVNPRCPDHGADAARHREKIALFGIRYASPPEAIDEWLKANPPLTRWQRFVRWMRGR